MSVEFHTLVQLLKALSKYSPYNYYMILYNMMKIAIGLQQNKINLQKIHLF